MDQDDHDLLVRIDERVNTLTGTMRLHLQQHRTLGGTNKKMLGMIAVAVIAALGSLAAALAK